MAQEAERLALSPRALYFLLCYASGRYDPRDELFSGETEPVALAEFLFRALSEAALGILRRGADRSYKETIYSGPAIRGRLDVCATMALDRGQGARAVSAQALLSSDVAQNNVIKTALSVAEACSGLEPATREWTRSIAKAFPGRTYPTLAEARTALGKTRLHRNNMFYARALYWSRLVLRSSRPTGGLYRLDDYLDRRLLNRAFESLVRKALRRSLVGTAEVKRSRIHWNPRDEAPNGRVPIMETDATVRGHNRCLVIDAKYYAQPFASSRFGAPALRSSHLYQIASYLRALRSQDPDHRSWSACLVYACAGQSFDYRLDLGDFQLQAIGLDLEQEPRLILDALASIWPAASDRSARPYMVSAPLTAQKHS